MNTFFAFQLESPHQTESHRSKLLSTYGTELLYQAKRKCNATQEFDIDLREGELVAAVEQKDPFGSTSRWLVDTGSKFSAQTSQEQLPFGILISCHSGPICLPLSYWQLHNMVGFEMVLAVFCCLFSLFLFWCLVHKGYVYSSFLRPYNPAKVNKDIAENGFGDDDFDNISLFVSSRPSADSSSSFQLCENPTTNGTETDVFQDMDDQHVSIIHTVPVFLFFLFHI